MVTSDVHGRDEISDRPDLKRLGPAHLPMSEPKRERSSGPTLSQRQLEVIALRRIHRLAKYANSIKLPKRESALSDNRVGVSGCVDAIFLLLSIFGYDRSLPSSDRAYSTTKDHWLAAATEIGPGGWMKFAKYKFAAFFHSHTQQFEEGPACPIKLIKDLPQFLCCGTASRFIARILRNTLHRDWFLASVLQLKKGCPRPSKQLVAEQVEKTIKALTTARTKPFPTRWLKAWADIPENDVDYLLSKENVIAQVRRTARELFDGSLYTNQDRTNPRFPSTSASFSNTRDEGGSAASISGLIKALGLQEYGQKDIASSLIQFRTQESEAGTIHYAIRNMFEGEVYSPSHEVHADVTRLERRYLDLYDACMVQAKYDRNYVAAVGLPEALKIRVISKGSPYTSFVLKSLQAFLWRTLSKHPVFKLIAKPVEPMDIQNAVGSRLLDDEVYLSGDYSAATDNLESWVSDAIADEVSLCVGLSPDESKLFRDALTRHVFVDEKGKTHTQCNGQLMGSVVSFPVLCIANAALCRWTLEVSSDKSLQLKQCPLLVNGDDCGLRIKRTGVKHWKEITSSAGLEPSIGKFFSSREFLQINSVNFKRVEPYEVVGERARRQCVFQRTPFINLGLLLGVKRSGAKVGVDSVTNSVRDGTIGSRARDLIESSPPSLRSEVMKKFISHHIEILKSVRVPWFVPESFGGVGLPLVEGYTVSELDLRVAARIRERPSDFPVGKIPGEAPWRVHRFIMERLPVPVELGLGSAEHIAAFDRLYGLLAVDTLFTVSFRKLFGTGGHNGVLKQNERSWRKALLSAGKGRQLPSPLSLDTLFQHSQDVPFLRLSISETHPRLVGWKAYPSSLD